MITRTREHALWISLLALLAGAVCYYSVMTGNHFVDSPHNGFFLKNAIDLLEGRVMFRDSFTSYGILSTVIHAAGMEVWGWRIAALLNVTLVFVVALGVAVYCLWSIVMPPWAAFLSASLYFVYSYRIHLPWPNYYATFFALCAGLELMQWLRRGYQTRWLVAAGLTTGVVFLARQTVAFPLVASLSFFIFFVPVSARGPVRGARVVNVAIFLTSFLAALLPFLSYLIVTRALKDWWIQSISLVPLWYAPFAQLQGGPLVQMTHFVKMLVLYLPFLTMTAVATASIVCLLLAAGRLSRAGEPLALLAALSLAVLSQVYPDEGLWRAVLALSVSFGWPVYLLNRLAGSEQVVRLFRRHVPWSERIYAPALVFIVVLAGLTPELVSITQEARTAFAFEGHKKLYFQYMDKPDVFRGMWLPKAQASFYLEIYGEIEAFRRTHPHAPVITTNGDVLPVTFVRNNEGFNPMFTVYPSIEWSSLVRGHAAGVSRDQMASRVASSRRNHEFESDTANVLAYADYWTRYADFVREKRPLVINSGEPVPHFVQVKTVVFNGPPDVVDSQYYFWWSQFSDRAQSVIWEPEL